MTHYEFEKQLKEKLNLKYRPVRFLDRTRAFKYSNRTNKLSFVMLGCDGRFWIVCGADASRLSKQGYEFAA